MSLSLPRLKPKNPRFSSGPCSKHPGYCVAQLDTQALGRSHRALLGSRLLKTACEHTAALLNLPQDYRVGIVPASDTGAMEMAMWSLLGARGLDIFAWESFGKTWVQDVKEQLKLEDVNAYLADYGSLPDLSQADDSRDIVFTWNGTTSGVRVPNGDWIADDRQGLTICDATSAVFAMDIPWHKLDVITFSWQKVLGGEGAHGMLILSPRAVERLESYRPPWPLPKIFRLTKKGKLLANIFEGSTINTPSMLCVADYLDALRWLESIGGQSASIERSQQSLTIIKDFVAKHDWISFLAESEETLSSTSVCLSLELDPEQVNSMVSLLAAMDVAYDIGAYRDAPPGLRIWCGATVEPSDVAALMPWLEWAYQQQVRSLI